MYASRLRYYNQLLFLCDQEAPHSSTSSMQEEEETTAIAAQHNSSLTADIMEMICTHLNYTLNWSIFFRFNCACVAKPLACQTEQTWHSLACRVKTAGKTVRVGPLTRVEGTLYEVLFTSSSRNIFHYLVKLWKGIWKSFAALLTDLPCFCTAPTAFSSAQGMCCSYLTSSCKYELFTFLKGRDKN